jgi:hypothetical protein
MAYGFRVGTFGGTIAIYNVVGVKAYFGVGLAAAS